MPEQRELQAFRNALLIDDFDDIVHILDGLNLNIFNPSAFIVLLAEKNLDAPVITMPFGYTMRPKEVWATWASPICAVEADTKFEKVWSLC
jgi:hypothetical protein